DGTPTSLVAVGHAAGVAQAAGAKLALVTAYDPDEKPSGPTVEGSHQLLFGRERAEAAMRASLQELESSERVRQFEQRIVASLPAQALLERAGQNPKHLIVVG